MKFNDEERSIEFIMVFDDNTKLSISPYIDKDAKFDINKNDLRLKYSCTIPVDKII